MIWTILTVICSANKGMTEHLHWLTRSGSNQFKISVFDNGHFHDDVIKWKHFPLYWPFVRGIHRSTVNSPHKGQWRGALMFSLTCVWINGWVNNRETGDLRRHHAHYDVTVMYCLFFFSLLLHSHFWWITSISIALVDPGTFMFHMWQRPCDQCMQYPGSVTVRVLHNLRTPHMSRALLSKTL